MHVILDGDQLSGKSTVASELRRYNRSATIIENRGLTAGSRAIHRDVDLIMHFVALQAFTHAAIQSCIVLRGPISAYANELSNTDELLHASFEILRSEHYAFFWLDTSYDAYLSVCRSYGPQRGFRPHQRAAFESRRARYAEALTLLQGRARRIPTSDGDYRGAAEEIAVRVGWAPSAPPNAHSGEITQWNH